MAASGHLLPAHTPLDRTWREAQGAEFHTHTYIDSLSSPQDGPRKDSCEKPGNSEAATVATCIRDVELQLQDHNSSRLRGGVTTNGLTSNGLYKNMGTNWVLANF